MASRGVKMTPRWCPGGVKVASRGANDAKMASRNTPRWRWGALRWCPLGRQDGVGGHQDDAKMSFFP